MSSTTTRTILVTGATGKQGGAAVRALVKLNEAAPSPKYKILALTRDASSEKAAPLASLPNVSVVQGNLAKPETLFNEPVHGLFLIQNWSLQGWTKPEEEGDEG